MPYPRIIPTLAVALMVPLIVWGQTPPQTPAPPQGPDQSVLANNVLSTTAINLKLRNRIAATVVQDVEMLNEKFKLEGQYYKDTGNRVRLQLNLVGLGDTGSTMLQVSDGKILWEFRKVLGMQDYRRRDLTPILKALENPSLNDYFRSDIMTQLGFGGPEALVRGFQKAIKFDQFAEKTVDGMDAWVLSGSWSSREGLTSPPERPFPPNIPLPPYMPSNVTIYIEKKTFWPFKIEMVGNQPTLIPDDTPRFDPATGRPVGIKKAPPKVDPSRITLRYTLLPETEIKPEVNFAFTAPREAPNLQDDTEQFMNILNGNIDMEIKRQKSEAAKNEGDQPLLKVSPFETPTTPNPATTSPPPGGSGTNPDPPR